MSRSKKMHIKREGKKPGFKKEPKKMDDHNHGDLPLEQKERFLAKTFKKYHG